MVAMTAIADGFEARRPPIGYDQTALKDDRANWRPDIAVSDCKSLRTPEDPWQQIIHGPVGAKEHGAYAAVQGETEASSKVDDYEDVLIVDYRRGGANYPSFAPTSLVSVLVSLGNRESSNFAENS